MCPQAFLACGNHCFQKTPKKLFCFFVLSITPPNFFICLFIKQQRLYFQIDVQILSQNFLFFFWFQQKSSSASTHDTCFFSIFSPFSTKDLFKNKVLTFYLNFFLVAKKIFFFFVLFFRQEKKNNFSPIFLQTLGQKILRKRRIWFHGFCTWNSLWNRSRCTSFMVCIQWFGLGKNFFNMKQFFIFPMFFSERDCLGSFYPQIFCPELAFFCAPLL